MSGALLAPSMPFNVTRDLSNVATRVVQLAHLFDPTELTFTTRDLSLRPGQTISVEYAPYISFRGVIDRIVSRFPLDTSEVHAIAPLSADEIEARRDAFPWLARARPNAA